MSVPDPTPPRKLSRWPLYGVLAALVVIVAGWSAAWLWARGEAVTRIDAGAVALRKAGYDLAWKDRKVTGYPFRLNVRLSDPHIRDRSGWALEAPRLEAQAFLHAPANWIVAAPDGLTFTRPAGGPVVVKGRLIRMSLSHLTDTPPNISFEGTGLSFQPAAGATPFGLTAAERVEIHVRRAPAELGDEAGLWVSVKDGKARLSGLLERIAGDKPISIEWDSRLSEAGDLRGATWAEAVRNWTNAGGRISVKRAGLTAGDALIGVNSGHLTVGTDGRLRGVLDLSLRQAPRAFSAIQATGAAPPAAAEAAAAIVAARQGNEDIARASLNFEAGQTTLGPIALWRAPKVYEAP
ncbi:DUF2125 domain-containing protein [uncultured Phenylobacterium sp.]|uniref:DUF2125 domain-containing protein n=1 Tax=uncultured Phenylobacterium sp. TaxID=349273 RepID=UPI0025CE32CD|nr:DUF2125 domain-containing protein [uncultured Phenylobacterium sp.]